MKKLINLLWIFFSALTLRAKQIRFGAIFPDTAARQQNWNLGPKNSQQKVDFDVRTRLAFHFALNSLNQQKQDDYLYYILDYSAGTGQTFQVTQQVCAQLSRGVAALVTSRSHDVIKSACSTKQMTNLQVGESEKENNLNANPDLVYTLNFNPSLEMWNLAVAEIVLFQEWKRIAVIFCNTISDVESLLEVLNSPPGTETLLLKAASDAKLPTVLRLIKIRKITNIVIHCNDYGLLLDILKLALRNEMDRHYQYVLYGQASLLVLNQNHYTFGQLNITTLSVLSDQTMRDVVEKQWKSYIENTLRSDSLSQVQTGMIENVNKFLFSVDIALMYDALYFYDAVLRKLRETKPLRFNHRSIPCDTDDVWLFGPDLIQALKNATYNGVTGPIKFDKWGQRNNIEMDVLTLSHNGLKKVGSWKSGSRSRIVNSDVNPSRLQINKEVAKQKPIPSYYNQTLKVTIIVESPYVFKNVSTDEKGKTQIIYTGYCIDLLNYLSDDLKFFYNVSEVKDGQYGNFIPEKKAWNGMEVDMAVAPLTINYDRERAVKFTKPYMSLGIGILYRTPKPGAPSLFGFLNPLSWTIWSYVIVAYLAVAIIMFGIARLSPYEWQESHTQDNQELKMENDFGLLDSLWFGLGTLMQQGSEIAPRSISTRLLAGVWWFFTLIIISSYTANLAAFLTVTRMESEITSADDLASQTRIKYGTLIDGATATFFKNSMLPTFGKMWHFMNETPDVFVNSNDDGIQRVIKGDYAYLMESSTMEYIVAGNCNLTQVGGLLDTRGYGIATTTSKLRDDLSVTILKLQGNGILDKLKHKWWREKAETCPGDDTSSTQSLSVANLAGAFVFLFCGAVVAIITAVVEFCFYSYSNAKLKKKKLGRELKLGLATICSYHNPISKTSFFDKSSMSTDDLSSDAISYICCSCMSVGPKVKHLSSRCDQLDCSSCGLAMKSGGAPKSHRYCDRFSSMVETVLNDQIIPPNRNGCISTATECITSSLNSSKDPDVGVAVYQRGFTGQAFYHDSTFESDLVSSSLSLPGGSPNFRRHGGENRAKRKSLCYFDSVVTEKERQAPIGKSMLKREPSELRRWKYANSRSLRYTNNSERRPSDSMLRNSSLCLESEEEMKSPVKNSFIDLNELSNLKQTVM